MTDNMIQNTPAEPEAFTGFPLRENCDPTNPYEAFLWMLVALPGQNGGQLIMPIAYLQRVSKRLWDLGARPVAEPTLKYQRPSATDPHWMTAPGRWVHPATPDVEPNPARKALNGLSRLQRAELLHELLNERDDDPEGGFQ